MKKKLLVSILAFYLTMFCASAYSAEITAIDFLGNAIGKVLPDAKVINQENNIIGSINVDGQIVNIQGDIIGGIAPQGVAIGNDFRVLGRPGQDGKIIAPSGTTIGRVLPNSLVINDKFDVIGAVLFPGIVYSDSGEYIGRLSGDGLYTNIEGRPIGFITPDGYAYKKVVDDYVLDGKLISSKMILSLQGELVGSLNPDGSAIDFAGNSIGQVAANGFIYDKDQIVIAKIAKNAYAYDNIGNPIGFITFDGKISSKEDKGYKVFYNNAIVDNNLNPVGFSLDINSTATDLKGRFLGIVLPTGAVIKGETTKGFISAKGVVLGVNGEVVGKISATGPAYNHKSEVVAHALYDGNTYNLSGAPNGFVKDTSAYDASGKISGIIYSPKAVFSNDNQFVGLSGITNTIGQGAKAITSSMYGYAFNEEGGIAGQSLGLDYIYNQQGSLIGLITAQGVASSFSQIVLGSVLGTGYVVDDLNKVVGKTFLARFIDNNKTLVDLLISQNNVLLNKGGKVEAKILPDSSVIKSASQKSIDLMPQVGTAYSNYMAVSYDGSLLGYVDYDNYLRDFSGAKIGSALLGGIIVDNNQHPIGGVVSLGAVMDFDCNQTSVIDLKAEARNYRDVLQGRATAQGYIISNSAISGYIAKSGTIINDNGSVIGYSSANSQAYNIKKESLGCIDHRGLIKKDGVLIGGIAQAHPVINFDDDVIARSSIDGRVINEDSVSIGYIQPSGAAFSNSGKAIGLTFKYKFAFDDANKFIGTINDKAEVIGTKSEVIANVLYDGTVVKSNKTIGYALYDFYVYDNNYLPIGQIDLVGQVTDFAGKNLGNIKRGFLLDSNQQVIARGNRDYYIRGKNSTVLGELSLNGEVIDNSGAIIGTLIKGGSIEDAENQVIAQARPLQYYSTINRVATMQAVVDKDGNIIGFVDENGNVFDLNGNLIGKKNKDGSITDKDGKILGSTLAKEDVYNEKGEIIGTTTPDGKVVDANGKIIGTLNENGDVVDANGNIIGGIGKNWYKKIDSALTPIKKPEIQDYIKSISIALTPDGEYLCDLSDDGKCIDKQGNILGQKQPDGLIIDDEGTLIGIEEIEKTTSTDVFIPSGTFGPGGAYGVGNAPTNLGPGGGYGPGERYDPGILQGLAIAQNQVRKNSRVDGIGSSYNPSSFTYSQDNWDDADSALSSWRVDMSEMILADKPIPAVIARSIYNTSTDTPVTAYVERNVYSEEGRNIIIPAGSRLIGKVGGFGGSSQGGGSNASKVSITWQRLIRPDGSMFKLDGSVTGDSQGRQGALGYINNDLLKELATPFSTAMLSSAVQYFIRTDDNSDGEVETSSQEAANDARESFRSAMDEMFQQILQNSLQEQVLIFIPAGTRIVVYPNKDLWLRTPERDKNSQAYYDRHNAPADSLVSQKTQIEVEEGVPSDTPSGGNSSGGQVTYNDGQGTGASAQQGGTALLNNQTPSRPSNNAIATPPPPPPSSSSVQQKSGSTSSAPVLF